MKIINYIGICALAGVTVFGCSGASNTGGNGSEFGNDNSSGGTSSNGDSNGSSGSGGSSGNGSSGSSNGGGASTSSSGGGGGASSGSSSGASSGSSSGSGSDDAGGGGSTTSDGGPCSDPETDCTQTKNITMSEFTVDAGAEVFYCQNFANPWGKQVDIKTYDLDMQQGSHHMFAFYQANATTDSTATPCPNGGLQFGAFTFTSQTQQVVQTYPATVGATIPATTGFQMMVHYLNTTSATITAHVSLTMYIAKSGVVTNHAGVIFLNQATMTVAATDQPVQSTATYSLTQDVYIMTSSSHMHKYATNFISTASSGQTLYTTTDWDEPKPETYSPPLHLTSGTTITWTCTDVNDTGSELTFGESASANVMCIAVDIFYPVSDITNPVLGDAISLTL